jgi:hypothetical protein
VLLSGDVHSSWAFEGPCADGTGEPVAVELTVPAVSSAAMGRAHYPVLWRLLDLAAHDMPHVQWADVTERGYVELEIGRDEARADWWFVHPYDHDPASRAVHGAGFVTAREDWPPRLVPCGEPTGVAPAVDATPALPLPDRPADLRRLRWRRRARLTVKTAAAVGALGGVTTVAWRAIAPSR